MELSPMGLRTYEGTSYITAHTWEMQGAEWKYRVDTRGVL